jgi:hypothetical protein
MNDLVGEFVERVVGVQSRLLEGWLQFHMTHSAAPPTLTVVARMMDGTATCECGDKLRVWVVVDRLTCTVNAQVTPA